MKYKYNGQWVDLSIKALDSMEVGSIIQYIGNTIPSGWLECNGASISQSAYPDLYNLIGGTLPDFRGRVLVGQDTSQTEFETLGYKGGSKYLQEHSHQQKGYRNIQMGTGETAKAVSWREIDDDSGGPYTRNSGTGDSGNLQPYAVVKHIIKAINTTPTMASIVDGYSTSTQDGYSCNYVNGINTYSTIEKRVGTWINGKPIYRKVFNNIPYTTGTGNSYNTGLSDIDYVIQLTPILYDGTQYKIGNYWYTSSIFFSMNIERNKGLIFYDNAGQTGTMSIILEYTKTTDTSSNTRNLQESKKSVSEEENFEDIEPSEER